VIIIILISTWLTLSGQWLGIPYLFGILLFVTAVYLKFDISSHSKIIMTISNYTYGIYLIHPLIYSIEKKIGFSDNFIVPFLTYALSLLIIAIANKIPGPFIKKII
jgi:membrane-bound acyltransferase YfiQ involved in biofilm formation